MGADDLRRVLIADAEASVRQELSRALLAHDLFSDCAATVPDARAFLSERGYGIVILDVGLPSGDVNDVVRSIAAIPPARRPVVLAVATGSEQVRGLDVEVVQIVLRRAGGTSQLVDLARSCIRSAEVGTSPRPSKGPAEGQATPEDGPRG